MTRLVSWFVDTSRSLVRAPLFDITVLILIILSVSLLVPEIALPSNHPYEAPITAAQEIITAVFALELLIRFAAMKKRSRFFREYWLDILAVIPMLRIFRAARFLRLLRLLRFIRLARLLTSNSRMLQALLQKRTAEYILTTFFVIFSVMAGTFSLCYFEHANAGFDLMGNSFWTVVFSLMSGQYERDYPLTLGGRLVILSIEFCSLSLFAIFTGTVSAVMIEKLKEGAVLSQMFLEDLEDHVLICGWNSGLETTLMELQKQPEFAEKEFVVIADRDELPEMSQLPHRNRVRLLRDDFTRAEVIIKANVAKASVALIVSDVTHNRSRQDADARTVLAALTIEKLNPKVHTCAELSNAMNEHHLRMGNVNEIIITQDMAGHLLAQAALSSAQLHLLQQMVRPSQADGGLNSFPIVSAQIGQPFRLIVGELSRTLGVIPVAVQRQDGEVLINPPNLVLQEGDILMCLGRPTQTGT